MRSGPAMTRSIASSSVGHGDLLLGAAGGQQRGLVDEVGEVGAGEARRPPREHVEVGVRRQRLPAAWTLRIAWRPSRSGRSTTIWRSKRPGAQQRRVEDVGPVRRGDEDHAGLDVEAVHLDEQLVEGLLALVVAAAHAGAAVAADRVDLVDEDDRGGVGLGLLEQVAHAAGADADEHLDEVRAGDREERHAGLAGHGARQQRLAGAGRPEEQHALGDLRADRLELGRVGEELLDLAQLLDGLVRAGDVVERDLRGCPWRSAWPWTARSSSPGSRRPASGSSGRRTARRSARTARG